MTERITTHELYLTLADHISKRGTCQRAQVGCVITIQNRIVSTGYNGPLPGEHDCNDINCDLNQSCIRAVHAEANAIFFAAKRGIALEGGTLYCRYSPCTDCVEALVQAGIKEVHFQEFFRDTKPVTRMLKAGVKVYQGFQKQQVIYDPADEA